MPEGPSIVMAREELKPFAGHTVIDVAGSGKLDLSLLENQKIIAFRSWGKHLLICFSGFTVRIHFLLFGSYLVNSEKKAIPKLSLIFDNGVIHFYACAIKLLEGDANQLYDWSADLMSEQWNARKAKAKVKKMPDKMVCDTLLDLPPGLLAAFAVPFVP